MKTIVIGDIHGCSGALRTLLAGIFPDPEKDRLILLGDLFDRGPESWEVFQKETTVNTLATKNQIVRIKCGNEIKISHILR